MACRSCRDRQRAGPVRHRYSFDGGSGTWTARTVGPPNSILLDLAVDPARPRTVYAADDRYGIWKSTDGGATWSAQNTGLPSRITPADQTLTVNSVTIAPTNHDLLYANLTDGLYRSDDAGGHWQALGVRANRALAITPGSPDVLYAGGDGGVWKSTDGGTSWRRLPAAPTAIASGALLVLDSTHLYAGSDLSGLWRSDDGGANWQQLPAGGRVDAIAVQPGNPAHLFVTCWTCRAVQESQDGGRTWATVAGAAPSPELHALLLREGGIWLGGRSGVWQTPVPLDLRYYPQTGFRISDDAFWNYFQHRGGVDTFGYPTSRTFTFLGYPSQFFQRQVMQRWPDGSVHLLNLLDPGMMPYASFNFSTFPAQDPRLTGQAPAVGSAGYGTAIIPFVRQHTPDTWNGLPVRFFATFTSTVTTQIAFGSNIGSGLIPALNLELWGVPTSQPAYDPHNHGFVYLRFQRGVMQYDANCTCTHAILLADYLKAILTGTNLPADLAHEAANSPFLGQYDPGAPNWVRDPGRLPNTDLTNAFTSE